MKPMVILTISCLKFNDSNLKKVVMGFTNRISDTMAIVIKIINGTKLFLYFKVVNME